MKICLSCEGVTNTQAQRCGHCGAWLLPCDSVHYPVRRGESDAGNPLLGTVVDGKYRLQAVLGRGGLGTVFQAIHIGSLMTVALKLLHPRFAERPEYRRALLPEARRAATVVHAGCARLLDVGEAEEGVAYLVMELVDGETLDTLMRGGPLLPAHAALVLLHVAEALEAIHHAGLVHCDLAPRNVMVATRGNDVRVKVLDFGIARTVTMAGAEKARAGEFTGFVNPVFSAPELLAGEHVDVRADMYSFGSLAWLLLTGDPPVDDADPRGAAMAVAAGELRPWPVVAGVPRRLQRLIHRCVQHDPAARPASAAELRHELGIVLGARRPTMARSAALALGLAVMATLAMGSDAAPPFLRPQAGTALELAELATPRATVVQYLQSRVLETIGLHFGGFPADRLRVDVSRGGRRLVGTTQFPEVDRAGGTMTLSGAQPKWRELLEGLIHSSSDGPVDVSFVVPGRAPLGVARVQIDDVPPQLEWRIDPVGTVLTGAARLVWRCEDAVGIEAIAAAVTLPDGRRLDLPLPGNEGTFDLGAAIASVYPSTAALGPGEVVVVARDRAGNLTRPPAIAFAAADLQAPSVVEVTGPVGQPFVPVVGDTARLRVRLSEGEAGCSLRLGGVDQAEVWRLPLSGPATSFVIDVPLQTPRGRLSSGLMWFGIVDAAGNSTQRQFVVTLREQGVRVDFTDTGPAAKWVGRELVLGDTGAQASVVVDAGHNIVRAFVELSAAVGAEGSGVPVEMESEAPDRLRLHIPALPPGGHVLHLEIEERDDVERQTILYPVPLRVLPSAIEVRVPASRSRFLPGLLDAGVLAKRTVGYGEGPGWLVDAALLPYVRGTLWLGADVRVPLRLPERTAAADALLPEVTPVRGRNVLAVDLRDVLDRPVHIRGGDGTQTQVEHAGRMLDVVADFWWSDVLPELVGEELLVEYGQPARLRVRFPLPFTPADQPTLLLGIAQSEIAALQVTTVGDESTVLFDVPFPVWSVGAQLAGSSRSEFAEQMERRISVSTTTPAGRYGLVLRVRTTRSTLEPVMLDQLGPVPPGLAKLRLLPVLAPAEPFAEPVPEQAPPRAMFRPQVAVAVRNMTDFLLQDREFTCGEGRALAAMLPQARQADPARFVHRDDPLGPARLRGDNLLPAPVVAAPAEAPLTGVDFFQAWTMCRLLGFSVGNDPELFRLPLGCELELAAYGAARWPACHGVAAHGGAVAMAKFLAAASRLESHEAATADVAMAAGDVVPSTFGIPFVGLDFGVREWVADLPHVPGAELLLREWIGDHATHLARVSAFASGAAVPPPDLAGPLSTLGVVRGLALGEVDGLVSGSGARVDTTVLRVVPDTVPGVLRTEQRFRDGRDLLSSQRDPRLAHIGFRVAGTAVTLARLRGRR